MKTEEFNDCVLKCTKSLRPLAVSLTRNYDDAQDLMQDTVLKALVNRDKFSDYTNLNAWIYTIMKNSFINNYRRNQKQSSLLEINEYKSVKLQKEAIGNEGATNIEMDYINGELNKLSADYREPFLMYYSGYKYHEIASKLDLPLGTIKSRIFLARKLLQKVFPKSYKYIY